MFEETLSDSWRKRDNDWFVYCARGDYGRVSSRYGTE
jgi:hypothetical protein